MIWWSKNFISQNFTLVKLPFCLGNKKTSEKVFYNIAHIFLIQFWLSKRTCPSQMDIQIFLTLS